MKEECEMAQPRAYNRSALGIRRILDLDGLQECVEFQRVCYSSDLPVVPRTFLVHAVRHGGLVLRAFDADEVMRGLLLSLPALCRTKLCLHTYATLVKPDTPIPYGTIVTRLKREEQKLALQEGYEAITWYQDPFDLDNAELGLVTLGARVTAMDRTPVGSASGFRVPGPADLSRGKLILTWELLRHPQVRQLDTSERPAIRRHYEEALIVASSESGGRYPAIESLVRDGNLPRVAITILAYIQEVCVKDLDAALGWRAVVLDAFDFYLSQGYSGTGERDKHEFRYLLSRIDGACVIPD